jgi:phospholipid-binding lipoprotein MlaA
MMGPMKDKGVARVLVLVAALSWTAAITAGAAAEETTPESAGSAAAAVDAGQGDDPPLPPGLADAEAVHPDPLGRFNEPMFRFNRGVDDWVLRPVARGYAWLMPRPVRVAVGRFFNNAQVIPRVVNNVLQLHFTSAGIETARFGVNTTVGLLGFFDPAQSWLDLDPAPNDFGLTCRRYGVPGGPYLMLPFFGPSTVTDTVGLAVDWFMNPIQWFVPLYVSVAVSAGRQTVDAINYRSLHLDQFADVDRFAVDLYAAVQDFYLQRRAQRLEEIRGKR